MGIPIRLKEEEEATCFQEINKDKANNKEEEASLEAINNKDSRVLEDSLEIINRIRVYTQFSLKIRWWTIWWRWKF